VHHGGVLDIAVGEDDLVDLFVMADARELLFIEDGDTVG
jgi:hypothetical protein